MTTELLPQQTMMDAAQKNVQILLPEQTRELLDLRVCVSEDPSADASQHVVGAIAAILMAKTALVCKDNGSWTVLAESGAAPELPPMAMAGPVFDRVGDATAVVVEPWTAAASTWTLVGLTRRSAVPAVLMLRGDWTLSASKLRRLGENLLLAEHAYALLGSARVRVASHRMTVALTRSTGVSRVAEVAVRHAARALRAQIVTLAVAATEADSLQIIATRGYPLKLVEHLRIEAGEGIMGAVYQSGLPLHVKDVRQFHGARRQRSRYRTNSFVAVPITAEHQVLGVLCATDRLDGRPFSRSDLATLRTLAAPVALALGRERALLQAGSYARAAAIDPVSGLFNRRYFHARLDEELQRAQRHALSVGLLMIDVDDFKSINDQYGHLVGDAVIRQIADILRRSVRVFDICTRFGGEEFTVVMPGSGADDAARIAERIRERIQSHLAPEPELAALRLTVSIGLAVSTPDSSAHDLIGAADMALYHAKRTGKNQVRSAGRELSDAPPARSMR